MCSSGRVEGDGSGCHEQVEPMVKPTAAFLFGRRRRKIKEKVRASVSQPGMGAVNIIFV